MKTIGKFLAENRKAKNLTQKEFADKLFVTESTVCKWETDKSQPNLDTVLKICSILNISEKEFLTAAEDTETKKLKSNSGKWTTFTNVLKYTFIALFGAAILTTFIVNLATVGTLNWFFIVLFGVCVGASVTLLPMYLNKHKLLFSILGNYLSLIVMILSIALFTSGNWFMLVFVPITVCYLIIATPIIITKLSVFKLVLNLKTEVTSLVLFLGLVAVLATINGFVNGNWFLSFALPLTAIVFVVIAAIIALIKYTKLVRVLKTALIVVMVGLLNLFGVYVLNGWIANQFNVVNLSYTVDLNNWTAANLNGNINFIVLITISGVAVVLLAIGLVKQFKKK